MLATRACVCDSLSLTVSLNLILFHVQKQFCFKNKVGNSQELLISLYKLLLNGVVWLMETTLKSCFASLYFFTCKQLWVYKILKIKAVVITVNHLECKSICWDQSLLFELFVIRNTFFTLYNKHLILRFKY